jgi:hypothetical protein
MVEVAPPDPPPSSTNLETAFKIYRRFENPLLEKAIND